MKPVDFELVRPTTIDEALAALADSSQESKVLAGGQSLLPLLNFRLAHPTVLVDIERIRDLGQLTRTETGVTIGAMVRQSFAEQSAAVLNDVPLLAAALPNVAHPPIRNRGTVCGSLAHGDPAAELPTVAVALDAEFDLVSQRGRRTVPASTFYKTYFTTEIADDELLVAARLSRPPARTGAVFVEAARRRGDFALVGVAVQLTLEADGTVGDARIAFSGVADVPVRGDASEEELIGAAPDAGAAARAAVAATDTIAPRDDLHATAGYRRDVAGRLLVRGIAQAVEQVDRTTEAA